MNTATQLAQHGSLRFARPNPNPEPALEAAAERALQRAREVGLTFQIPRLTWVTLPPGADRSGETYVEPRRQPRVFLADSFTPQQAFEAMLHELQHVADGHAIAHDLLSTPEAEALAEAFVRRASAPNAARRQQLLDEGERLAARAERAGRFTHLERARADQILAELDGLRATAPITRRRRFCAMCGALAPMLLTPCTCCGNIRFD